jgi:hypothetical protein
VLVHPEAFAGRVEWWVKIRTKDGVIGWTKESEKFSGKDAWFGSLQSFSLHCSLLAACTQFGGNEVDPVDFAFIEPTGILC